MLSLIVLALVVRKTCILVGWRFFLGLKLDAHCLLYGGVTIYKAVRMRIGFLPRQRGHSWVDSSVYDIFSVAWW